MGKRPAKLPRRVLSNLLRSGELVGRRQPLAGDQLAVVLDELPTLGVLGYDPLDASVNALRPTCCAGSIKTAGTYSLRPRLISYRAAPAVAGLSSLPA